MIFLPRTWLHLCKGNVRLIPNAFPLDIVVLLLFRTISCIAQCEEVPDPQVILARLPLPINPFNISQIIIKPTLYLEAYHSDSMIILLFLVASSHSGGLFVKRIEALNDLASHCVFHCAGI